MKIRSFIHLLVSLAIAVLPMAGHAQQTPGTGYVGANTAPANTDNDSVHFNAAPGQPVSGGGGGGATDCPLQTRTWTNGAGTVSCSADVPATTNGNTTNVSDSIGSATGTASFTCNAGALNLNPGAVCNGPAACPAGTPVSWTVSGATCNGALASNTPSGANTPTVTDSTAPTTGAATFACTNGSLSVLPGATCSSASTNCTTQSLSWTVGGATCNGTIAATTHGGTNAISDSTAPTTGSASFACNNGTYTQQAGATCSTAAPSSCAGQSLSWTVGGTTCDAVAPTTSSGNAAALTDSTAPTTGSASFACSNGTFTQQAGATCSTTSTSCAATTLSWSVGGNSCSGTAPITSVGGTANINSASANSGQATFACQAGGTWSTSPNASPAATCNAAPACTTWTTITLPTVGPGVHYPVGVAAHPDGTNNLFVASQVNSSAGWFSSTNGTSFTSSSISMVTAQQYSGLGSSVVVGGNQLAAGYVNRTAYPGPTGGYYDSILVTRNGAEITNHPALTVPVASGAVAMATDGSNVVVLGFLENENSAVNGGLGRKAVTYRSTDGGASYLNVTNPYLNTVNSAGGCSTSFGPNFTDMAFAAGRFIAVGQDTCNGEGLSMHSTDGGASWTAHPVIPPINSGGGAISSSALVTVAYSGSRFVRGGFKATPSGFPPYIDTSTDGVNFVQSSISGAAPNGQILEIVNRGSGVLFAVSRTPSAIEMLRSSDHGQSWSLANNAPPSSLMRSYMNTTTGEWYVRGGGNPATLYKSTCN